MDLFCLDAIIGETRLSDYGLTIGFFGSSSDREDELGLSSQTKEEFVGYNSVPVYLGATYSDKLNITLSIVRNPCCPDYDNGEIPQEDLRAILRNITGRKGYQVMQVIKPTYDEPIHYNVRCTSASVRRIGDSIVGIILGLECDSPYAWTEEYVYTVKAKKGVEFLIHNNSDCLDEYLMPKILIKCNYSSDDLTITNKEENRTTQIMNVTNGESIYMDSKLCKIESSTGRNVIDDFNLNFIRLVSGVNKFVSNADITITFTCKEARKVGVQ